MEEFLIFCFLVAGKSAEQQALKLNELLRDCGYEPIPELRRQALQGTLQARLRELKLGKYKLLEAMLAEAWNVLYHMPRFDLRTATSQELRQWLPGFGWKTAKFFILHSREGAKEAVIDTYVLKFLRKCYGKMIPAKTPGDWEKYKVLEALFLAECYKLGVAPHTADIVCWRTKGQTIDPEKLKIYDRIRNPAFQPAT